MDIHKKKVAIINGFNPLTYKGGIETFILHLKGFLETHEYTVHLHHFQPSSTLALKPFPFQCVKRWINDFLLDCFMFGRAFSKIQKDYDLVISNNFYGLGYFEPQVKSFNIYHSTHAGYADALRGRISEKDYRDLKYLYGYGGDWLSGRKKTKIAVSRLVSEELRKYYGFRGVMLLNHAVDTAFFKKIEDTGPLRMKWGISADLFVGIFVGRWEIGKGTGVLSEVIRLRNDIEWILVTDAACPLGDMHNVRTIHDAGADDLRELYSLADFMLFPSCYEGFGLVLIEAMACKLPVICTPVGIIRDFITTEAVKKMTVPLRENQSMIRDVLDKISFLREHNGEREAIGNTVRALVEQQCNKKLWEDTVARALGIGGQ